MRRSKTLLSALGMLFAAVFAFAVAACAHDGVVRVTFDANGGKFGTGETVYAAEGVAGDALAEPPAPAKDGMYFAGWAESGEGAPVELPARFPDSDRTYYAVWEAPAERTLTLVTGAEGDRRETLTVVAGSSLDGVLAAHLPAESDGMPFAGWYDGRSAVAAGATMPDRNLTLTAKYYATYTYSLYLQNADGSYAEGEPGTGRGIYGNGCNAADGMTMPEHYKLDPSRGEPSTAKLGKGQSFTVYLARTTFTATFEANSADVPGDPLLVVLLYGAEEGEFPESPFSAEYFRFAGWAESADGAPVHQPGEPLGFVENGAARYYAVWDIGYRDFFGGDDVVYLPAHEEGKAYLHRGGSEYAGRVQDGTFVFGEGDDAISGKIFERGHMFAYERGSMAETYTLWDNHLGAAETTASLTLDGYLSGTYTYVDGEGETVSRRGTYFSFGSGEYFFGFDEPQGDVGFYFTVGERGGVPVFSVRKEGEEGYYTQLRFTEPLADGAVFPGVYSFHLDGYGNVLLTDDEGETFSEGRYKSAYYDEESYGTRALLVEMQVENYALLRFVAIPDEEMGVCVLEDGFAGAYAGEADGADASLTLDGFSLVPGSAQLTVGGERTEGTYRVRSSEIFGEVLDFYTVNAQGKAEFSRSFQLFPEAKPVKRFAPLDENFTEYWRLQFTDNGYGYWEDRAGMPVLVIYDTPYQSGILSGTVAKVYDTVGDVLSPVSEGFVTKEQIGRSELFFYSYHFLRAAGEDAVPFRDFRFLVSSSAGIYCLMEADGKPFYDLYREKEGGGMLYFHDSTVSAGARFGSLYVTGEGDAVCGGMDILPLGFKGETFFTFDADDGETTYYFVSRDKQTFELLEERPAEYILVDRYGSTGYTFVSYRTDGRGHAEYGAELDEYGSPVSFEEGTYARTGTTFAGEPIYTFTGTDGTTMQYITYRVVLEDILGIGSMELDYYHLLEEGTAVIYTGGDASYLQLDGFAHNATYVSQAGSFDGTYTYDKMSRDTVIFLGGGKVYTLELDTAAKTFRDVTPDFSMTSEVWQLRDTNYEPLEGYEDATVAFRENGTLTLENGWDTVRGTYETIDEEEHIYALTLNFPKGTEHWTVELVESYYNRLCVVFDHELAGTYTARDLSQLTLDGYGFGTYTDSYGFTYDGYYTVLTEKYLAFFIGDSSAFFVAYDPAGKTFSYPDHSQYLATYYSETFSSVMFAEEGVFVDGYLYGFYAVEDGEMLVFAYDYYTDSFTEDDTMPVPGGETYVYQNTTYYRWSPREYVFEGTLAFDDVGLTEKNVSATLTFSPDGQPLFETEGTLVLHGAEETTLPVTVIALMDSVVTVRILDEFGNTYVPSIRNLPAGASFTLQGGLVERVSFGDIVESGNSIYYGYYGFGSYHVSASVWNFAFDATDSLGAHIFSSVQETFPAEYLEGETHDLYGRMYEIREKGTDGADYVLQFMLVDSDLTPVEPAEDGESGLLLVYAAYRTGAFETADSKGNEMRIETKYYVYANVFDFTAGTNDVLLYVKRDGEFRHVAYSESDSRFSEDGDWAVLVVPNGGSPVVWLLEYTLAEDGSITAIEVTQGNYAEQLSADERYYARFFYVWEGETFEVVRIFSFGYTEGDTAYLYRAQFVSGDAGRWTAVTQDGVYTLVFTRSGEVVTYSASLGSFDEDIVYRDANGDGTITFKAGGQTVSVHIPGVLENAEADYTDLVQLTVVERYGVLWAADLESDGQAYTVRFFLGGTDENRTFTLYSVGRSIEFSEPVNKLRIYLVENAYANAPQFGFRKGEIVGADLYEETAEGESYLEPLLVTMTPDDRFVFYTHLDPDLGLAFSFRIELFRGEDGFVERVDCAQVGIYYDRDWLTSADMPFSALVEDYEFENGKNLGVTKYTFYYYGATDSDGDPLIVTVTDVGDKREVATFGSIYAPVSIYLVRGTGEDGMLYDVEYADRATVSFEGGTMNSSVLYSVDRVARFDVPSEGGTFTVDVTQAYHVHTEYLATPDVGALAFFSLYEDGTPCEPVEGGITYDAATRTLRLVTSDRTYTVVFEADGDGWFTGAEISVE